MIRQPNGRNLTPDQDRLLTELVLERGLDLGDERLAAEFRRQTGRPISPTTVAKRRWETPGAWVPDPANHVADFDQLRPIPDDPDAAEVERRKAEALARREQGWSRHDAAMAAAERRAWRHRGRARINQWDRVAYALSRDDGGEYLGDD